MILWLLGFLGLQQASGLTYQNAIAERRDPRVPTLLDIEVQEHSRNPVDYRNVRLPMGGNEDFTRRVRDNLFVSSPEFQEEYQLHKRALELGNVDRRLDDDFFSIKNTSSTYSMPEATFQNLLTFMENNRR